jgi:O-acetylhomoserine/O-acetylserine sulfhydrylase-like pyridoxal-dependent enzyme
MIRRAILRLLAILSRLIGKAQSALSNAKAEVASLASTVDVEITHEAVAIADNTIATKGFIARLPKETAEVLISRGHARRV